MRPGPMHYLVTAFVVLNPAISLSETELPRRTHCSGMLVLRNSHGRPPAGIREGAPDEGKSSAAAAESSIPPTLTGHIKPTAMMLVPAPCVQGCSPGRRHSRSPAGAKVQGLR